MPVESPLRDGNRADFELIETLRWESRTGFVRLERHLARLCASADALGFAYDPEEIDMAVAETTREIPGELPDALRIRLTLAADGTARATSHAFALQPKDTTWTLRIAQTRLDSHDPLLRHKTSRRSVYEAARAEFTHPQADEVILLNERREVCEGTITNLFVERGDGLVTPPLNCGLLAGILRAEMIESGEAREAVLMEADLRGAKTIFVGNSLRGLIQCKLTG